MSSQRDRTRLRGENWTQEEKELFIKIMRHSAPIIDNKLTDTNANKKKSNEWIKVQERFEEYSGKRRDVMQLKGFWRRLKQAAKSNDSQNKKESTEGQSLTNDENNKNAPLCTTDVLIGERNNFDDGESLDHVFKKEPNERSEINTENLSINNVIPDIEINENIENKINLSFLDEVMDGTDEDSKEGHGNTKTNSFQPLLNRKNKRKSETNHNKAIIVDSNINMKKMAMEYIEEEYTLKIEYQKRELCHQKQRHEMELKLLLLDKEKKDLEIQVLRQSLHQ